MKETGFCEGCRWLHVCGTDDNDYPCHGSFDDIGYIDYGNELLGGKHSDELWYLDEQ